MTGDAGALGKRPAPADGPELIELASNVYYVPGKNKSRFPYCACLYIAGKKMRVLIDAGMGASRLAPVRRLGVDVLILSHCHIDHRLTRRKIPLVPVWCHEEEAPYLEKKERFFQGTGLSRSGVDLAPLHALADGVFEMDVDRRLKDGEEIDLGGLTLVALHTPGHTPGHLAFHLPEARLLFSADVDLTPFGPYYGHDFADIDDFIRSIDRLKRLKAAIAATGHAGPFTGDLSRRFDAYEAVVSERDDRILDFLKTPRTLDAFKGANIIYKHYPEDPFLIEWFELVHVSKHLERLSRLGRAREDGGLWRRSG